MKKYQILECNEGYDTCDVTDWNIGDFQEECICGLTDARVIKEYSDIETAKRDITRYSGSIYCDGTYTFIKLYAIYEFESDLKYPRKEKWTWADTVDNRTE